MNALVTKQIIVIPSYSDLKERPKDPYDAAWMIFIVLFLCGLWYVKDVSKQHLQEKQAIFNAKLEAEKVLNNEHARLIAEREETIDFLQQQIKDLYAERSFLMKSIGMNSDFLKKEVSE